METLSELQMYILGTVDAGKEFVRWGYFGPVLEKDGFCALHVDPEQVADLVARGLLDVETPRFGSQQANRLTEAGRQALIGNGGYGG
jgi:hypothetical protein